MPSISPITFGNMETNLRLAAMLSQEINLLLTDSANLRNSPFMSYQGSINGSGSDTVRVRLAGLGRDSFAAALSENQDHSGDLTSLTVQSADLIAARQYLIYKIDDLASMTRLDGGPDIDPFRIAQSIAASYEVRFAELSCASAAAATTVKGSNTTTFSTNDFFNGIFALETADSGRGADGPFAAVLDGKALSELQDSLRGETGNAVSRMASSAAMLEAKGKGFAGELFGVQVFRSSHVKENASSGYDNFMLGPDGLAYVDGIPDTVPGAVDLMSMGKVAVEFDRRPMEASVFVVGHMYLGCGIIDDSRLVKINSAR